VSAQTVNSNTSGPIARGASGHGGLSPWVVRNTLVLWGSDFKTRARVDAPASLADLMPTVLRVLALEAAGCDSGCGRVLEEALRASPGRRLTPVQRTVTTASGAYRAALRLSSIAGHDYVDPGGEAEMLRNPTWPSRKNARMRRLIAAVLVAAAAIAGGSAQTRPNVVLILADDLGYGDVGAFNPGGRIPTPHLDRLAREGLRFTDAHTASAVCTPTRYALLTGRYPWRTRMPRGVLWGNGDALIEPGRMTLASLLRDAGYHTAGIGKWHLGLRWAAAPGSTADRTTNTETAPVDWIDYSSRITDGPTHHGFDEFFGLPASLDMRDYVYIDGDRVPEPPTATIAGAPSTVPAFHRPGRAGASFRPERVLGDLTARAVQYVRGRSPGTRPFFLYLPLASPHTPVLPTAAFAGRTGLGPYADFVAETDAAIGEVLQALEQSGAAKNTLVMFASDNGPAPIAGMIDSLRAQGHDSAGGWRGAKQDLYEGGHRVPLIVRWPGVVAPGTTARAVVGLVDVLATLAEMVGRPLREDGGEDSVSFLPLLRQPAAPFDRRSALVFQSGNGSLAIRDGRWKLCLAPGSGGLSAPVPGSADERALPPVQLFDLETDPRETTNLQAAHPEIVGRLTALLERYRNTGRSR
jgi:arylsulfatase A